MVGLGLYTSLNGMYTPFYFGRWSPHTPSPTISFLRNEMVSHINEVFGEMKWWDR
jgi:hypothetical protein